MFEFANPWLFLLLPIPVVVYFLAPGYKQSQDAIRVPFFQTLADITGQQSNTHSLLLQRTMVQKIGLPLSWLLLVLAMAQPQSVGAPIEQVKSARDLMVAVDLSGSMEVDDFITSDGSKMNRLDVVKMVLSTFAQHRKGDRLGLIVFGDAPYLQVPFTQDVSTWLTLLNETDIAMAGQSTVIGDAIGLAISLFKDNETQHRVLVLLTDGNDTGSQMPPVEAAKVAAHEQVKIYTIAIGDPATIGEEALDVDTLEQIADITNGGFFHALDGEQLQRAYREIERLEPEQYTTQSYRPKRSLHHYPLAIIVCGYLLFFAWMMISTRYSKRPRLEND